MSELEATPAEALGAILNDPHGCPRCDSGKLRNPEKDHWPDCGYALAAGAIKNARLHELLYGCSHGDMERLTPDYPEVWHRCRRCKKEFEKYPFLPDYGTSLDAMHAVEAELARRGLGTEYLCALSRTSAGEGEQLWRLLHATAAQRRDAAIRVLEEKSNGDEGI